MGDNGDPRQTSDAEASPMLRSPLLWLMLGAVVIIWLTEEHAGWEGDFGRTLLALRLIWGITILAVALWPLRALVGRLMRRLRSRTNARRAKSHRADLLASLNLLSSKPASSRGG